MKKILLATTMLVGFVGAASADVTVSGYGRFGLVYASGAPDGFASSGIAYRMRLNFDGSMTTDGGVTFGGRIRMESDNSTQDTGAHGSPAMLYASANGMRLEVGNANTAYDSAALFYNSEMGFGDASSGEPGANYFSFQSKALPSDNYMGIFFSYSAGPLNARLSYMNPDQTVTDLPAGVDKEIGISGDYTFGKFIVSAGFVQNGGGAEDNDQTFLGAEYAVSDAMNVGLLYWNQSDDPIVVANAGTATQAGAIGNLATLYGNYTFGATTVRGYVSNSDEDGIDRSTVIGIGADYDLGGGARISGSVRQGFDGEEAADLGVRFDF